MAYAYRNSYGRPHVDRRLLGYRRALGHDGASGEGGAGGRSSLEGVIAVSAVGAEEVRSRE